ncbi:MAG: enoyl-CoA hydratase/isomerase family protein [Bryobacteraceae bacterium]|nr:enoyl-CoA hydratase/isomerase family protein [Bryobacteraceae bacterium]
MESNEKNGTRGPIRIEKSSAAIWRVFLDDPPLNLLGPAMIAELHQLVGQLEADEEVKVVIFESAVPDFFIAHVDLLQVGQGNDGVGSTGMAPWPDFLRRLEQAPFVTIGVLRGRARGVGSEFLQALDMRFASRERAWIAQIEVGCGIIPGGGGLDRLPRLIGRGRAIEAICGADDFDAPTAELYGWINRALPDDQLDNFVTRLANRISTFDRKAVAESKRIINERAGLATKDELNRTYARFLETLTWPATQARLAALMKRGLQTDIDFERDIANLMIET